MRTRIGGNRTAKNQQKWESRKRSAVLSRTDKFRETPDNYKRGKFTRPGVIEDLARVAKIFSIPQARVYMIFMRPYSTGDIYF